MKASIACRPIVSRMRVLAAYTLAGFLAVPTVARAQTPVAPAVEAMLVQGNLGDAERQLNEQLRTDPADDNALFALGVTQTLQGVERLVQSLYRYGLQPPRMIGLPFVRLPVPHNPDPTPLTNQAFRSIIERFSNDLARAEATLAQIESGDVRLPLHFGLFRLDMNDDGRADGDEALWKLFNAVARSQVDQATAEGFLITFDTGDVHWLRGYCHLLQAACDVHLAYDTQRLHSLTAQLFFPSAEIEHEFLRRRDGGGRPVPWQDVFDLVAFIHLLDLPVADPQRLPSAREHLLEVIAQSRASWAAIRAETDDQREWIPSPTQKDGVVPNAPITEEMVEGWHAVLDETEAILNGEKLVPFWRSADGKGVNLKRVFTEPRTFDLVLWVQGSAAAPYLEEGEVTDPEFWRRIQRGFRGQFFWFAIWVN